MEIEFFGGNCFRIKTKETTVVVDDNLSALGGKSITTDKSASLYTQVALVDQKAAGKSRIFIDSAGEFEIGDLTITGMQARGHMDEEGEAHATVFQFMAKNQKITVTGHIHPDMSSELVEFIAGTDVLVVPVGGGGYTLDPVGATKVMKKAESSVVIPSQYETKGLKFEVPPLSLDEFTKLPNIEPGEPQDSFKMSELPADDLAAATAKVVILNVKG